MILYMYIAPGQGLTTPWGQNFDVNRNLLSLQSYVASFKKSPWSLILYNKCSLAGADSPQGTKFWCQQICLVTSFVATLKEGSGDSAGPGQIVPRGYSIGPGQIVTRLFSRTRRNSYNALIGYLTGPKIFMPKYLKKFLFVFRYLIMCIVLRVYTSIFFYLYTILFCAVLENMVKKGLYVHV